MTWWYSRKMIELVAFCVMVFPISNSKKTHIDRRIEQMRVEGVEFRVKQHIGVQVSAQKLKDEFDAVVLTGGAEQPRDLPVPGRELQGVHFAMEFLPQQNRSSGGRRGAQSD